MDAAKCEYCGRNGGVPLTEVKGKSACSCCEWLLKEGKTPEPAIKAGVRNWDFD